VIPSSVVVLGEKSFSRCKWLESVRFERGSRLERIEESAFTDSGLESIEIPSSVTSLGPSSFRKCETLILWRNCGYPSLSLESLAFECGSRLDRIEEFAFAENRMESIVIPSSVVVLGKSSFAECNWLKHVGFEKGYCLERIEESAFSMCGLQSIAIPSSVVVLGILSFHLCTPLAFVSFENDSRLDRIEDSAFRDSGLKSITIPPLVTFIDGSAFVGVSLNSISISPDNQRFRLRDWFLESFDGSTIYRYLGRCRCVVIPSCVVVLGKSSFCECDSLESVVFESGCRVERIEELAFSGSKLKSIVIPSSVVILGKQSFEWCTSLESVAFETGSRVDRIEALAFSETGLKSIVIPSSVMFIGKRSIPPNAK
jgi:hypothetical protein